jgi:hypothetical protein
MLERRSISSSLLVSFSVPFYLVYVWEVAFPRSCVCGVGIKQRDYNARAVMSGEKSQFHQRFEFWDSW